MLSSPPFVLALDYPLDTVPLTWLAGLLLWLPCSLVPPSIHSLSHINTQFSFAYSHNFSNA
jgi:hypothetical protein